MHVGEIELLLALGLEYLVVLLAEVIVALLHLRPGHVFLRGHHDWGGKPSVAHAIADDVAVDGIVVHHIILHVVRSLQVERTLIEVGPGNWCGSLDLPTRMEQGIWDGILINKHRLRRD